MKIKRENKLIKKLIMFTFTMMLVLVPAGVANASTKSNAENVLKYYQKGNISKAKKYNKQLAKEQSKTCIKKLSKKAKAAYKKVVKKYKLDIDTTSKQGYLWGYYLVDMNGDKKAELLVQHGTCEADVRTTIYTYKGGKAEKIAETFSGHTGYYAYPGHSGVICVWGHMGYESVSTMAIKNGKIETKSYGGRDLNNGGDWFPFKQALYGHIKYSKDYKSSLDLEDLQ